MKEKELSRVLQLGHIPVTVQKKFFTEVLTKLRPFVTYPAHPLHPPPSRKKKIDKPYIEVNYKNL